ncbi:phage tail family protein [Schinkia azotoformans]|uniref:phage tail domain-containing protein n=1 Tax=Schinkia azotoformans TaxID=1454 RepID=UPI002DBD3309|nr:phage tail domain-containing protein [Schinkia azotoformans]MEC1726916.1 phage tail family protein [Schinkia azotoformans]
MHSIYFSYDGIRSDYLGVYLVHLNSDLVTDPFLGERQIISESIVGNDIPYIYNVQTNPLQVTITLSCLDGYWTLDKRRELARLLDQKKFCEFFSTSNIDKLYYLQYIGGIDISTNRALQGYLTVKFINISPYSYSSVYEHVKDLSSITEPTMTTFENIGDNILYPEMWIQKIGTGDVSIRNFSNSGAEFKFTNLLDQEIIYLDNRPNHHYIKTNLVNTYRYDNFNGNYLELPRGVNRLEVTGACKIKFLYQFELKG